MKLTNDSGRFCKLIFDMDANSLYLHVGGQEMPYRKNITKEFNLFF